MRASKPSRLRKPEIHKERNNPKIISNIFLIYSTIEVVTLSRQVSAMQQVHRLNWI
jgi:hypothetical protein